jgi:fatty acid desaturase
MQDMPDASVTASQPDGHQLSAFIDDNGLRRLSPSASTTKLVFVWVGWIGLFVLARAVDNLAIWWCAWIAMAFLFEAMGAAVHEAAHDKLYRARWQNRVAGWIMAAPRLYNFATYQISHLEHHRHTHDRDRDPEPLFEKTGLVDYVAYMALSGTAYSAILFGQGLLASFGRGPAWYARPQHKRRARFGTVIVLVELAIVVAAYRWDRELTIQLWLVPYLLCNVISSLVTKPEHYECAYAPEAIYDTTRTIYSNRLFGFFLWNNNLHTAHHLVPTLPGHALPQLQEYIDPHCANLSRSYLRWHVGLIRALARKRDSQSMMRPGFWTAYAKRISRTD